MSFTGKQTRFGFRIENKGDIIPDGTGAVDFIYDYTIAFNVKLVNTEDTSFLKWGREDGLEVMLKGGKIHIWVRF